MSTYRQALLDLWETQALGELEHAPSQALLEGLAARVGDLVDLPLEAAVRAWAFHDPDAAATQERVDRARLVALESIWSRIVDDPARARTAALIPHLLLIGATVALPRTSRQDLESVFGLLSDLIPSVSPERTPDVSPTTRPSHAK